MKKSNVTSNVPVNAMLPSFNIKSKYEEVLSPLTKKPPIKGTLSLSLSLSLSLGSKDALRNKSLIQIQV